MTLRTALHFAIFGAGLMLLTGCSALSSIQSASRPVDTFELTPLPEGVVRAAQSRRQLEVALPTATGALASDSIVIKPTPLQIEALSDGRWVNETTELVQLLLVRSLTNTGRFGLVTAAGLGPPPDYVLMTDLRAFQAEVAGDGIRVVIRSAMTLIRDTDDAVLSSRRFSNEVTISDSSAQSVAAAFDQVMTAQMTDVANWLVASAGG